MENLKNSLPFNRKIIETKCLISDDSSEESTGSSGDSWRSGDSTRFYRRNLYCGNCGRRGHLYKACRDDITSFGVIAVRRRKTDAISETTAKSLGIHCDSVSQNPLRILLVQRKDTMGYVDFLRGRYPNYEPDKSKMVTILFNEMIESERQKLASKNFTELWDDLWINHSSKCYKNEYASAKVKFEQVDVKHFLNVTQSRYQHTEFSLPKGRRNNDETNAQCAEREFREETGYNVTDYLIKSHEPFCEESFVGTNGKKYKHIYYLVEIHEDSGSPVVDKNNKNQIGEIKSVGWYTRSQALALVRPYDTEKKKVINYIFNTLDS